MKDTHPHFDLGLLHCGELLCLSDASHHPKRQKALSDLSLLKEGAVGIIGEKIAWVGSQTAYEHQCSADIEIDAQHALVMPSFVDPHTHAVFAGNRSTEWQKKLSGMSYIDILKYGGGILSTVKATRQASSETLFETASKILQQMAAHGTGTVEIKSGYGLNFEQENKILDVIQRLTKEQALDVVASYLGAHALPLEAREERAGYVSSIIASLPKIKNKASFCDVFCEEGAFTFLETEKILKAAKAQGLGLKLHAGQFSDLGGLPLASELKATSIDHLDVIDLRDISQLAASGTVGVLLPGVNHFLKSDHYAPARDLIEGGVPIALATDFNPGSSPCLSMQTIIHLAVLDLKMTPAEAISAATINAAHAISRAEDIGSLEVGKQADIIILDLAHFADIPYYYGTNHVRQMIKKGKVLF